MFVILYSSCLSDTCMHTHSVHFSHILLFATLWTVACQASVSMGILQARILEWVVMLSSRGSSQPRDQPCIFYVSCIGRWIPGSSWGKESAYNAGDPGSIPGSGRSAGKGIGYPPEYSWASLVSQLVKNPPAMRETWVGKIPWRRRWQPTPVFLAWRIPMDRVAWRAIVHGVAKSRT